MDRHHQEDMTPTHMILGGRHHHLFEATETHTLGVIPMVDPAARLAMGMPVAMVTMIDDTKMITAVLWSPAWSQARMDTLMTTLSARSTPAMPKSSGSPDGIGEHTCAWS
jgi:hypothetical protein